MERRQTSHTVEFVMESYRVSGDLVAPGGPRRLVDIMNSIDESFVVVRDATIDDPVAAAGEGEQFPVVQIHMSSILFGLPYGADIRHEDPFETVQKVPTRCRMVLPGFELTANVHMVAEIDPAEAPLLGARHFVALTDAKIRSLTNPSRAWDVDVVVVNLSRAVLFAPHAKVPASA
jgi:hypothetical protein